MAKINLVDFIEQEMINEASEEEIRSFLRSQGYDYRKIEDAFRAIDLSKKKTKKLMKIKKIKEEELDGKFFAFLVLVITIAIVMFIYTLTHIIING